MLRIWGRVTSSNVQKALWLAQELGLAYENPQVGGPHGGLDSPAFRALTPMGLIPVLEDDGFAIWESEAILRYLAARYGGADFWSQDPKVRSWSDRWMAWAQTRLQPDFVSGLFWGFYRTPVEQRDAAAIARAEAATASDFLKVEEALADRPFLSGPALGLADIVIGSLLYRYFEMEVARPPLPRVEAWYRRLQMRPAYANAVMVPFDSLKGRLSF